MSRNQIEIMQANATKALKIAVKKALARHEAAGVPAAIWRDGKVVYLKSSKPKRGRAAR